MTARSAWPALLAGALGGVVLLAAMAAFSPAYRSGLYSPQAQAAANDARYVNLAMAAFATGAALLALRGGPRRATRLIHLGAGLALAALAALTLAGREAPSWESQELNAGLLGCLLLSGLYGLLKPTRILPGSDTAARLLHVAFAAAYVVRFFGEPLIVAMTR